jgi:hypothetical protein
MPQDTDLIREQMANTRCSISEKLDLLERRVVNTVNGATDAVAETVETVKESVRDSVHSVQTSLDPIRQAERHPWTTLAVSLGAGYVAGRLLEGSPSGRSAVIDQPAAWPRPSASPHEMAANHGTHRAETAAGWVRHAIEPLEPEIRRLKELGVGMLFGLVRDFLHEAAPESMRARLTEVADDVTRKMGGQPVQGPVIEGIFSHNSEKERLDSACSRERRPTF